MIKTKEFIDRLPDNRLDSRINDFLAKDNVRYIDVKYQISAYGYADSGVNDKGTETSALLIYKDGGQDDK